MWTPVNCVEGPVGDPGDEDVVGVVDEVVAGEGVDEVALAAQVRGGDDHELTVPGRGRHGGGAGEQGVAVGGANSAAAIRIVASSLVRDSSTIAAIAAASPTASRWSRCWGSVGDMAPPST